MSLGWSGRIGESLVIVLWHLWFETLSGLQAAGAAFRQSRPPCSRQDFSPSGTRISSVCMKQIVRRSEVPVAGNRSGMWGYSNDNWRNEAALQRSAAVHPSCLTENRSLSVCSGSFWLSLLLSGLCFPLLKQANALFQIIASIPFIWNTLLPWAEFLPCPHRDLAISKYLCQSTSPRALSCLGIVCHSAEKGCPRASGRGWLPFILRLGCSSGA